MKKASIVAVLTLLISASSALKADEIPPFPDRGSPNAPHAMAAPTVVDQILAFFGLSL